MSVLNPDVTWPHPPYKCGAWCDHDDEIIEARTKATEHVNEVSSLQLRLTEIAQIITDNRDPIRGSLSRPVCDRIERLAKGTE